MAEQRVRVLVVDDEEFVRGFLVRLLSLEGAETTAAESGAEAIRLAKEREFDLFLIDMKMPGLDGIAVLRAVRILRPLALCAMITGCAEEKMLADARREGAVASLIKPFDLGEVLALLRRALPGARSAPDGDASVNDDPLDGRPE
jgi:CheY-like chemotaxis protein